MVSFTRKKGKVSLDDLKIKIQQIGEKSGKVGWFETAKYEDGTPVAAIAAIQELGSPKNNIPPRPMLRSTASEKDREWTQLSKSGYKAMLAGNETEETVMNKLVLKAAGDVAKTISKIASPPLKQGTINARKRKRADKKTTGNLTKPLIDTGVLFATVTGVVE